MDAKRSDLPTDVPTVPQLDVVDRIIEQWSGVRPDLDSGPIGVIGRISRFSRLIDRRLAENFAAHGIEDWMYDVMATLYRSGPPYELSAGALGGQTMVTTGAITNRIDRLEARDLVERARAEDRRRVIVRLTASGVDAVESVVRSHLSTEREMLAALSSAEQIELAGTLRRLLIAIGDAADPG
jgi:DNA-binding MarR family transcriptional regulator